MMKKTIKNTLIIILILLSQFKTVAQAKENANIRTKIEIGIKPTSTVEELTEKRKIFKDMFDVSFDFSILKINESKKIIALKIICNDNKGNIKTYEVEGLKPIKSFSVYVEKDEMGYLETGFNTNPIENGKKN
ncbi:hypothetical protein [Flavobacterium psychrotolerans]|uniref:Uncharacterized protein n=1 Tax=Flavobacterium psychrotolerans TaxID=2169410 RepID=A0A2U1JID4_9FLAO|nr:hypothetical protein [Flavobacterium psychrotolerans]PWA04754.1 hypothetical protein DB895_09715 [Flavobacterium psychrotolerans]